MLLKRSIIVKKMLKKPNRLTKKKEFDNVFKSGRSSYAKIVGVKVSGNEIGAVRVGILVSNKVSKKAVERNKIKRWVREIFQELLKEVPPADYVVIVLPGAIDASFGEIKQSLHRCLKTIGAIKKYA